MTNLQVDGKKISDMWAAIEMVVDAFRDLNELGDVEIKSETFIGAEHMKIKIEVAM